MDDVNHSLATLKAQIDQLEQKYLQVLRGLKTLGLLSEEGTPEKYEIQSLFQRTRQMYREFSELRAKSEIVSAGLSAKDAEDPQLQNVAKLLKHFRTISNHIQQHQPVIQKGHLRLIKN